MITNLVELQGIQKLVEFPVFASFFQFDVVLLQSVKSEFCLVIDKDFERLYAKL